MCVVQGLYQACPPFKICVKACGAQAGRTYIRSSVYTSERQEDELVERFFITLKDIRNRWEMAAMCSKAWNMASERWVCSSSSSPVLSLSLSLAPSLPPSLPSFPVPARSLPPSPPSLPSPHSLPASLPYSRAVGVIVIKIRCSLHCYHLL